MGNKIHDITIHKMLGKRFRQIRRRAEFNQETIAKSINVSPQQMQKYEMGDNRFPLDKLWVALNFMGYSFGEFMNELEEKITRGVIKATRVSLSKEDYKALNESSVVLENISRKISILIKKQT